MANHLYEVSVRGQLYGNPLANVFHFEVNNSGSDNPDPVMDALVDALDASAGWFVNWLALHPVDLYYIVAVAVRCVDLGSRTYFRFAGGLTHANGTRVGTDISAPNWNAGLEFHTAVPKRDGRAFISGQFPNDYITGVWDATYEGLVTDFGTFHLNSHVVSATTFRGVVAHRDGFNGGYSYIENAILSPVPWQMGKRRYPIGG